MTDTKHTPTPWILERVSDSSNPVVAEAIGCRLIIASESPVDMHHDNAAHIVKCVNLHDELVEALFKVKMYHPKDEWPDILTEIIDGALDKAGVKWRRRTR